MAEDTLVDPGRVADLASLAAELDLLRRRAAGGTRRVKVGLDELARRIGVPRSTAHTYLTGKTLAPVDVLDGIVIALGAGRAEQRAWAEAWLRVATALDRDRRQSAATVPIAQLPPIARGFVGRQDYLRQLHEATTPVGAEVRIVSVDGIGGVGKTALTLRWAHAVPDDFPDGQLWADLHGYGPFRPVEPSRVLDHFLRALGVPGAEIPADLDARSAAFRGRLSGRRMLVVLDNAASAEQVRPLLPGGAGCAVVVTSRAELSGLAIRDGAVRIQLRGLDLTESLALFGRVARVDVTGDSRAIEIAERCGGLPLALRVAAHRVTTGLPVARIASELSSSGGRLAALSSGKDSASDLRTVLLWSYQALPTAAATLFRRLGLHPGSEIGLDAAAALAGDQLEQTRSHLRVLTDAQLIEGRAGERYGFHDLLGELAAELSGSLDELAVREQAMSRLLEHYRKAMATAVEGHDLEWLDLERQNLLAMVDLATKLGSDGYVTELSTLLWDYLGDQARYGDAVDVHTAALEAARRTGDQQAESRALVHLAGIYGRMGQQVEAIHVLEACITLARSGGDELMEYRAQGTLGIIHAIRGELDRALGCEQASLAIARRIGDPLCETRASNNLGGVLLELDRAGDALHCFLVALALARQTGQRRSEAKALCSAGAAYSRLGRYAEATDAIDQALRIGREDGLVEVECEALTNLGITRAREGHYDHSLIVLSDAVEMARSHHLNSEGCAAHIARGDIYRARNDPDLAAAEYRTAADLARTAGHTHREATALSGLAALCNEPRSQD